MPGARCTRSLACEFKKHTSVVTTGPDGFNRHSPRNGFNGLFRALPGERILVVTVAHGLRLIKPGRADFASIKKTSTGQTVRRTPADDGTSDDAARAVGTGIVIGIGIGLGMGHGSRGSGDDSRE